jgi:hypothetical protein
VERWKEEGGRDIWRDRGEEREGDERREEGGRKGGWRMEDDGGWRMENGGWRMEDGGWRMEDGGWRMEEGGGRRTRYLRDEQQYQMSEIEENFLIFLLIFFYRKHDRGRNQAAVDGT